ncbi:hypothetical protein [Streptomyces iakyrus]|uniref:hypothetical protein n=1 Tax=Streptomyces iakyrus TaxID=68219 RepID=UPI0036FE12AC
MDAHAAATAVFSGHASGTTKSRNGIVEAIRALRVVRKSAVKARTQTINQIRSLMVTAPSALRGKLRGPHTAVFIDTLARARPTGDLTDPSAATTAMRRLARRFHALQQEIKGPRPAWTLTAVAEPDPSGGGGPWSDGASTGPMSTA